VAGNYYNMTGCTREELLQMHIMDPLTPQSRIDIQILIEKSLKKYYETGNIENFYIEVQARHYKKDTLFWIDGSVQIVVDENREPSHIVGVSRDIDAKKQIEFELDKYRDNLEKMVQETAEKNEELGKLHTVKDKLFSVVAHDLRSPMGALVSVLKLAGKNMLDAETQAQLFKDISMRVDDTYGLLDNLLRWAKSQMQGISPMPVSFDAREASHAVTYGIQYVAANKEIVLNNFIENHQIFADRDMFAVVLRNLTMNAIKYTSAVGEVTLASELSNNMLIISVKDNGIGMPQDVHDKLFKLSETQSRRGTNNESGTGLGLVLCADFAKANGGSIWFTSKVGEGSTFYFSVPLKES
jgi:PAS domain S-box-containing protein